MTCNKSNHEIYVKCGGFCEEELCYKSKLVCTMDCRPGCYCKPGYLRDLHSPRSNINQPIACVLKDQCTRPKCNIDEIFSSKVTICTERTCDNKCKNLSFLEATKLKGNGFGCICKFGLFRDENGKCVRPDMCFTKNLPQLK